MCLEIKTVLSFLDRGTQRKQYFFKLNCPQRKTHFCWRAYSAHQCTLQRGGQFACYPSLGPHPLCRIIICGYFYDAEKAMETSFFARAGCYSGGEHWGWHIILSQLGKPLSHLHLQNGPFISFCGYSSDVDNVYWKYLVFRIAECYSGVQFEFFPDFGWPSSK